MTVDIAFRIISWLEYLFFILLFLFFNFINR